MRTLAWRFLPRSLLMAHADRTILQLPDRVFLARRIVPAIIARQPRRFLNIGVHYYTCRMQQEIADAGVEVFTADPDGRKGRWGAKGRHRACAAEDLDSCFEAGFDAVLLNGVLGYGLDSSEQVDCALGAIADLLRSGGVLVIGWDANMSDDPLATGKWRERYEPDADLLGEARVGRRNGLIDAEGRPATKYFDVLRRAH